VLNERRAAGVIYDSVIDVMRVLVDQPPGTVRTRTLPADLLLDADGFLVGVDVEPESPGRTIVMVGPHEQVSATVRVKVGVCTDASGGVFEVRIAKARDGVRGDRKNPYV
jgi:hypothetical protein